MQGATVLKFEADEPQRSKGRIVISSGNQSRNRDWSTGKPYRLVPAGMRTEYWEQNPLVFYMHNFMIPLGTGPKMYVDSGQLVMDDDIQFHRKKIPVFGWLGTADEFDTGVIADLWEERVLNSVSIHVMMTPEDMANVVETEEEVIIPTSEVVEVSVVTVPGDRDSQREEYEAELLDAMERKGVEREMAECVSCNVVNTLTPFIPPAAFKNGEQTVPKGSFVDLSNSEVSMSKKQVEETKPAAEEVIEPSEVEVPAQVEKLEFEQEIELSVQDSSEAIAQDDLALRTVAMALVKVPEFIQAISEAVGIVELPHILEELEATPLKAKIVFSRSGKQSEPQVSAQPVSRPVAVQQAAAAPVAMPQPNGTPQRKKPSVLNLLPPQ